MDTSTRILRGLVVLEWLLLVPLVLAGLWLPDSLPPALRGYQPESSGLALALCLLGGAVWLLASIGVFLLWRPARPLYLLASAGLLALQPALGPSVVPPWAVPFEALGSMVTGALVAVLYLSPAAAHFGSSPPEAARAPRSRSAFGGGVVVGFLSAFGALALAFVGFGYALYHAEASAAAEGRAFGADRDDLACTEAAAKRPSDLAVSGPGAFLSECLAAARPTEGFCADVPAHAAPEAAAWLTARCGDKPSYDDCVLLAEAIQQHCHPNAEES